MTTPDGTRQHEGWTARGALAPDMAARFGANYVDEVAFLLRREALWAWANDPHNNHWHPAEHVTLHIEQDTSFEDPVTFLRVHIAAAYKPDGVPSEVTAHVHGEDCEHPMVPTEVEGVSVCHYCDSGYINLRYCPDRCASTGYAIERAREYYVPPSQTLAAEKGGT